MSSRLCLHLLHILPVQLGNDIGVEEAAGADAYAAAHAALDLAGRRLTLLNFAQRSRLALLVLAEGDPRSAGCALS